MSGQRPYRSRKQKPCNACRKRKICCIRTAEGACQLCELRNIECVVEKEASVAVSNPPEVTLQSYNPTRPASSVQRHTVASFVGLSSDLDPFILRHKQWLKTGTQHSAAWQCERIGKSPLSPAYFTASTNSLDEQRLWHSWADNASAQTSPSLNHFELPGPQVRQNLLQNKEEILVKVYFEQVDSTYPLLPGRETELNQSLHPILKLSLCLIALPFSPLSHDLDKEALTAHIYSSLMEEAAHATLHTLEAFLIFAQRHGYAERFPGSPGDNLETGMIIPMAHNLGLNMDSSDWDIHSTEKKRRKKLWWAVYMHDKWSALALGRPSLINDSQTDVGVLVAADFMEDDDLKDEASVPLQYRVFISMASLTLILSDILTTFYTIKAKAKWLNPQCSDQLQEEFERLDQLLQTWGQEFLLPLLQIQAYPDPLGVLHPELSA